MAQFTADIATLHQIAKDIATAKKNLTDQRKEVSTVVDGLLNGGWQGNARTAYAAGWTEWGQNADKVLESLDQMARAVEATVRDYEEQDRLASTGLRGSGSGLMAGGGNGGGRRSGLNME